MQGVMAWWRSAREPVAEAELQPFVAGTLSDAPATEALSTKALVRHCLGKGLVELCKYYRYSVRFHCVPAGASSAYLSEHLAQVSVKGMHCSSCTSAVERMLLAQPGVASASVALLNETAEVGTRQAQAWSPACELEVCRGCLSFSFTQYSASMQVVFNASEVTVSELLKAIQDAGFAAELLQTHVEEARTEVCSLIL